MLFSPTFFQLQTPHPTGLGAIGAIALFGDIDGALAELKIRAVRIDEAAVRDLAGIDTGVVARWSLHAATIMPHAGPAVVRGLLQTMVGAGLQPLDVTDVRAAYP